MGDIIKDIIDVLVNLLADVISALFAPLFIFINWVSEFLVALYFYVGSLIDTMLTFLKMIPNFIMILNTTLVGPPHATLLPLVIYPFVGIALAILVAKLIIGR